MKKAIEEVRNKNAVLLDSGYLVEEDSVASEITYIHTKYTSGSGVAWKECSVHSSKMMYDETNEQYYCPVCEK